MHNAWTLAALLYGALIDALCFGPKKNPRTLLPRFVIADAIARVRPFEALLRRLLFAQAQNIVVKFRAAAKPTPVESDTRPRNGRSPCPGSISADLSQWVPDLRQGRNPGMGAQELCIVTGRAPRTPPAPKPAPDAYATKYEPLPHNPFAYRDMMWPDYAPYHVIRPAHPLDGMPGSWKHVRFHLGAGDYADKPERGPLASAKLELRSGAAGSGPPPVAEQRSTTRHRARSRKPGGPEGPRSHSGSRGVPWYKLTDAEKEARRWRRGEANVAASLRADRAEALLALPLAPTWTADDLKDISTVAIMRRLEAVARVIADPAPYAKRIARKLALKPALVVKIAKRVGNRLSKNVSEMLREAEKCWDDWVPPPLCHDSS